MSRFQEQTFGRHKYSGAPLGLKDEFAPLGLDRNDKDGNPIIAENAHVRLGNAAANRAAEILRRGYSYNDGVNFTAERWPPWRQGMEYDAGLLFMCYQRDPRTGFIKMFEKMAKFDMLNQFVTHTGGGLFACPGGVREGDLHRATPVRDGLSSALRYAGSGRVARALPPCAETLQPIFCEQFHQPEDRFKI